MGLRGERRKVNMKDEYYVSVRPTHIRHGTRLLCRNDWRHWERKIVDGVSMLLKKVLTDLQKLQAKDLEDWEQRRVKRLPGEPDGTLV